MDIRGQKARDFVVRWQGHGDEKQETQKFWMDLLQNVLDRPHALEETEFEKLTALGGYIDVLSPNARFLVEQKSANISLDKPESRQGTLVTPVEQALRYANYLPADEKPTTICTCNFQRFRFYDLNADPAAKSPVEEFTLDQLPEHLSIFDQVFAPEHSRIIIQQKLSERAGELVANLHNALAKEYLNPDAPEAHHALATLTVRIVFCLYAEDSGLFRPAGAFESYVRGFEARHLRGGMLDLFKVLDTPYVERDPYLDGDLKRLPYVNGGLFAEPIEIPQFTDAIRDAILYAGKSFNWKDISPVIFGSLMEETLSHDQRRAGGMHYTTVENIHRVIDPLFLDGLKDRLNAIETTPMGEKARENRLREFQTMIASLQFLDPACGSGNFLTETFLELRRLENRVLTQLLHHQGVIEFGENSDAGSLVKVSISQMHGIEINDFAVSVAKTALWIAQQQALDDTESIAGQALEHLPLHDSGSIVQANALQYDWDQLLPGSRCNYVMGNPPFIGQSVMSERQRQEMKDVWGNLYSGYLDYATGWHKTASEYLRNNHGSAFAFVSTNSVAQGQPVSNLFKPLFASGWRIRFAHQTFAWSAESSDMAHVHVVIIGMDQSSDTIRKPVLYTYETINSQPQKQVATHINPYLIEAADFFIEKRLEPLSRMVPSVEIGSKPSDGGSLFITSRDEYQRCTLDAMASKYVHPFVGAEELIRGKQRWCFWLVNAPMSDIQRSPVLSARVKAVKSMRLSSKKIPTQRAASTPQLFTEIRQPSSPFVCIPRHFSENRRWATVSRLNAGTIAGDACFTAIDTDGFLFSIVESSMFITWQKVIGGRIKSDYRFSNTIVWNNLPLPAVAPELRERIIDAGKNIERVRAQYPDESLASLYSALGMHPDLIKAHEQLDRLVDRAFGAKKPCHAAEDRLTVLFARYGELTAADL